jgi:hypothetical protein
VSSSQRSLLWEEAVNPCDKNCRTHDFYYDAATDSDRCEHGAALPPALVCANSRLRRLLDAHAAVVSEDYDDLDEDEKKAADEHFEQEREAIVLMLAGLLPTDVSQISAEEYYRRVKAR